MEAIETINMANQVDITEKTARIDCVSWPVEVPVDVCDLVQLVTQLGKELDPKCDT